MGFQVSPGVNVTEIDLTTIVPAVATTAAGMAGVFQWGPAEEITLVDSVNTLKRRFGGPDDDTFEYFFTAANFLGYGNNLQVVRTVGTNAKNSVTGENAAVLIKNETDFESAARTDNAFYAKYPGPLGNALAVHVFDGSVAGDGLVGITAGKSTEVGGTLEVGASSLSLAIGAATAGLTLQKGDIVRLPSGQSVTVKTAVTGATLANISPVISIQVNAGDLSGATLESKFRNLFSSFDPTTEDVEKAGGCSKRRSCRPHGSMDWCSGKCLRNL